MPSWVTDIITCVKCGTKIHHWHCSDEIMTMYLCYKCSRAKSDPIVHGVDPKEILKQIELANASK